MICAGDIGVCLITYLSLVCSLAISSCSLLPCTFSRKDFCSLYDRMYFPGFVLIIYFIGSSIVSRSGNSDGFSILDFVAVLLFGFCCSVSSILLVIVGSWCISAVVIVVFCVVSESEEIISDAVRLFVVGVLPDNSCVVSMFIFSHLFVVCPGFLHMKHVIVSSVMKIL